jgi:hypothetical protein
MHVTLAGLVLFLHIGVVIVSFMIGAVLHAGFHSMVRARTLAELRPWTALLHRLEPVLPILAVVILGLGAWLVQLGSDEGFSWSDGWILTSVVTLVVIEGLAGALLAPRSKAVGAAVARLGDGEVPADLHRMLRDPVMWAVGHVATFGFLGVVFLMAAKPSGAWSPAFPIVGALVGLAAARVQLRAAPVPSAGTVPGQRVAEPVGDPAREDAAGA